MDGLRHKVDVKICWPYHRRQAEQQLSNQVEAFKTGQLATHLGNNPKVLRCPKDVAESSGLKKNLYLQRPIKIHSYDWNGQVGGYIAATTGRFLPGTGRPDFQTQLLSREQHSAMGAG
jgi:hypothetical protein